MTGESAVMVVAVSPVVVGVGVACALGLMGMSASGPA
jgi:hypothetical protein